MKCGESLKQYLLCGQPWEVLACLVLMLGQYCLEQTHNIEHLASSSTGEGQCLCEGPDHVM